MGKLLAQAVAREMTARRVPSDIRLPGDRRYVLDGTVYPNRGQPGVEFVAVIQWTLKTRLGRPIGHTAQGVDAAQWKWDYGDPPLIAAIGREAAERIAPMLADDPDFEPPVKDPGRAFFVRTITGAPGDGNQALVRAVRVALVGGDMAVAPSPDKAGYLLDGRVTVTPPEGAKQNVRIVWVVHRRDGAEVGRAWQENLVDVGSLDGPWGGVADQVAVAAVPGIRDVLVRRGLPVGP